LLFAKRCTSRKPNARQIQSAARPASSYASIGMTRGSLMARPPDLTTLGEEVAHPDVVQDPIAIEKADEAAVAHDREDRGIAETLERLREIVLGRELREARRRCHDLLDRGRRPTIV